MLTDFLNIAKTGTGTFQPVSIEKLSAKLIADQLNEIIISEHVDKALIALYEANILSHIIIGFDNVVAMKDTNRSYKDLWPHTIQVVSQSHPTKIIRWSAFFHDFGKPETFKKENGIVSFHRHEQVSVRYFKKFAKIWNKDNVLFSENEYKEICFLIYNLGYVESYESNWTDSAVRRFIKDTEPYTKNLLLLSSADITTIHSNKKQKILNKIEELRSRIESIKEKDALVPVLPKGIGKAIIDNINKTGPVIGEIKSLLEEKINQKVVEPYKDIDYYVYYLNEVNYFNK